MVDEYLSVAKDLYKTKHWLYVAFMCHQALEKILKAYWVATKDDDPPYIHDHKRLAEGCGLYEKLSDEQRVFLTTIREMNIEARYREFKNRLAASLDKDNTKQLLDQTIELEQWIRRQF